MKLSRIALAFVPAALGIVQLAVAGPFCGGCSDPCGPAPRHHRLFSHRQAGHSYASMPTAASCGYGAMGPGYGYAAPSMQYSAPEVCAASQVGTYYGSGTITADGGYATSVAPSTTAFCEPVTGYRVVMEPQFVTETVAQPSTELRTETRYRVKTINKSVPVTQENFRVRTVMKPVTETKTVQYTVLVPETTQKTVDLTVSVPVWNDVSESYTVKVPQIVDVPEQYTVRVPTLRDETFTYTVHVPQTQIVNKTQTVTNAVPVTKTRQVQRAVPVYTTKTVQKDCGHWETIVEEVAAPSFAAPVSGCGSPSYGCGSASSGCGSAKTGCGRTKTNCGCSNTVVSGCGSNMGYGSNGYAAVSTASAGCGQSSVQTVSRRVWVPNVVTEEVPVVTSQMTTDTISYTVYEQESQQVPYECTYLVYVPELRTGTRKVVDYMTETRTRNRKMVQYNEETRSRTRKVMSYQTQTKTESYPYVSYKTEERTKEVSFTMQVPEQIVEPYQETRYEQVSEQVVEEYQVQVQVPTMKEAQVQVMRMVPKMVPYTYTPCCSSESTGGYSVSDANAASGGCGSSGYSVGGYDSGAVSGCGCSQQPAIAAPCCGQ